MTVQQTTAKHHYVGYALEDLAPNTVQLKVLVPELTPGALTGSYAPGTTQTNLSSTDFFGNAQSGTVTTANHIVAAWKGQSNSAYPPFVRKGEQVEIVQYGDADQYYWTAEGRNRTIRQTDRHRIEVGATPNLDATKDDTNTYSLELDSTTGAVRIKTSKANSEPYAYVFQIDAANGTVSLTDDKSNNKNSLVIDSNKDTVQLTNDQGASVILKGPDVIVVAPRDFLCQAKRQVVFDSPQMTFGKDMTGALVFNAKSIAHNAQDMVVTTTRFGVNGTTKLNGSVVAGNIRATQYGTGVLGSGYSPYTSNIFQGNGTSATNTTDDGGQGVSSDRHAAAFEQVSQALQLIEAALAQINAKIGVPTNNYQSLNTLATQCEMSLVMGA